MSERWTQRFRRSYDIRALGNRLTKSADCHALVDFAVSTFGRIDVLFNNAAMAYFNWLEDITDEEWNRDLRE